MAFPPDPIAQQLVVLQHNVQLGRQVLTARRHFGSQHLDVVFENLHPHLFLQHILLCSLPKEMYYTISPQLLYSQVFTTQTKDQQFNLGSVAAKVFLGLSTTKHGTNLHGIQIMLVSIEKSYFIKHTDIFTIYGLFIKNPRLKAK